MTKSVAAAGLALTLQLFQPEPARAHPGTGIVVDRQGRVYFTDLKRIWRWEPGGGLTAVVTGKHSHALRLDSGGNLEGEHLTYDSAGKRWWTSAWRLAPDGSVSDTVPPVEGFPDLFTPAVAPDGTRYYAHVDNNRRNVSEIRRRRPDGSTDLLAGGAYGFADGVGREARFGPIGAIAVGPGGDLYVTDEGSVRKVTAGGRVTTLARGGRLLKPSLVSRFLSGRFGKMMGLAVDARGDVFAANYGGGRVVEVSSAGQVTSVLESWSPWSPSGVALSGSDIYVLESGTMPGYRDTVRVRRKGSDGRVATLAIVRNGRPERLSAAVLPLKTGGREIPANEPDRD
jgi:hypothetical protein